MTFLHMEHEYGCISYSRFRNSSQFRNLVFFLNSLRLTPNQTFLPQNQQPNIRYHQIKCFPKYPLKKKPQTQKPKNQTPLLSKDPYTQNPQMPKISFFLSQKSHLKNFKNPLSTVVSKTTSSFSFWYSSLVFLSSIIPKLF